MKLIFIKIPLLLMLVCSTVFAQVGIGTIEPDASAALELKSINKGFLPPRMSTNDRNNISSPAEGLIIYNIDTNCLQWFNGAAWYDRCEGGLTPGPLTDCNTEGFTPPYLTADETIIKDVTNPNTNQTWMDRNLGAYTVARASEDCWAYGNLYQWGRNSDGHENRNSTNSPGPVTAGDEGSNFITSNSGDWLDTTDNSRWGNPTASDKSEYDPCPDGYRVPTQAELEAERSDIENNISNNSAGAFQSLLKLPVTEARLSNGALGFEEQGFYWSSSTNTATSRRLLFNSSNTTIGNNDRVTGLAVRCIKD